MRSSRIACATAACTAEHSARSGSDGHDRSRGDALPSTGRGRRSGKLRDYEAARPVVRLADDARRQMQASVDAVERAVTRGEVTYGINTGFGAFASKVIPAAQTTQAPAQPHSQPRLRQRCAAPRDDRAAHAPAQGQHRRRLLRSATRRR